MEQTKITKGFLKRPVGVSGEMMARAYEDEELRVDDLTINDYRRMLDNDGQMQMLWNSICNTIISAGILIQEDPDLEKSENESEELKFIKNNLLSPRWKGGMSTDIYTVNRTILRAFIEGYRIFEVIYRLDEDGKIRLDRLAPRSGKSDGEIHILVDDSGNFIGYSQKTSFKEKMYDIRVINGADIKKVVKATYGEEFGSNYGRSGFKAAWYHYDKAHKGMFLNGVGHELGCVKLRKVTAESDLSDEEQTEILDIFSRVYMESTIIHNKNKFDFTFEDVSNPDVMREGTAMINFHYSAMAKSVLAQFVDLGSSVSEGGSRSTEQGQQAFFKSGLQAVGDILIARTWNQIIPDLIKINFGAKTFPTLKVGSISNESSNVIFDAFNDLVRSSQITDSVKKEVLAIASSKMGLDVNKTTIEDELEKQKEEKLEQQNMQLEIAKQRKEPSATESDRFKAVRTKKDPVHDKKRPIANKKVSLSDLGEEDIREENSENRLYRDQESVKFSEIKTKLDSYDLSAITKLREDAIKIKTGVIKSYVSSLKKGLRSINAGKIELTDTIKGDYSENLRNVVLDAIEYGKIRAAEEIGADVPGTPRAVKRAFINEIDMAAEEQGARLKFRLGSVANNALRTQMSEEETKLELEDEYDKYFDKTVAPFVSSIISRAFNAGRKVSFDKNANNIFGYRYAAILDSKDRDLHGSIVMTDGQDYKTYESQIDLNSRSIWTAITKQMAIDLDITAGQSDETEEDFSEEDLDKIINIIK